MADRGKRAVVGTHSKKGRTFYKVCDCGCNEEFTSTKIDGKTKPGHNSRKPEVIAARKETFQKRVLNKREYVEVPTKAQIVSNIREAEAMRPECCGKCGATSIEETLIADLVEKGNGLGVGWRCFMCGWVGWALPGADAVATKHGPRFSSEKSKRMKGAQHNYRQAGRPRIL